MSQLTNQPTSPVFLKPKEDEIFDDSDTYVEIDGFKFKLNEDDPEAHSDGASSHNSSSHEQSKIEKPKIKTKITKKQTKKQQKPQKQPKLYEEQPEPENAQELTIKVLDRKVKLTKFDLNGALYPLCRAWMSYQQLPKYAELDYLFTQHVKRPDNGLKILKALFEDDISCISLMPAAISDTKSKNNNEIKNSLISRIPTAEILGSQHPQNKSILDDIIKSYEKDDPAVNYPNSSDLLAEHLRRAKRVKLNWKKHTRAYDEQRFGVNFAILDTMFKMQMQKNMNLISNEILS